MNKATLSGTSLAVAAASGLGNIASRTRSKGWYSRLRKPRYVPPNYVFPVAWTTLYADVAVSCAAAIDRPAGEEGRQAQSCGLRTALVANLIINAGWSWLFFRYHNLGASAAGAALLTVSSADLVRRVGQVNPRAGGALTPYPLWCVFATAMSTHIWWLNC